MKVLYVPFPSPPSILYCNVEAQKVVLQCGTLGFEGLWHYIMLLRGLIISWTHRNLLYVNEHTHINNVVKICT